MSAIDAGTLLFLGAIWGGAFALMRVAVPEFGPFAMVGLRIGFAALVLLPFIANQKNWSLIRKRRGAFLAVGMTTSGASFPLMAYATLHLGAGIGAVLNGLTPVFTALIAWAWLKQKLAPVQALGIGIAWCGVALLASGRGLSGPTESLWDASHIVPFLAAILGTFLYGASANLAKVYLGDVTPTLVSGGSLLFAAIVDLPIAYFYWPSQLPSLGAWTAVLILGVGCTAMAYILYFRLVERIGVSRAISVTFLVPVFGIAWGALFLNESISAPKVGAALLILAGTALINRPTTR